jgi:hypothetical protein
VGYEATSRDVGLSAFQFRFNPDMFNFPLPRSGSVAIFS